MHQSFNRMADTFFVEMEDFFPEENKIKLFHQKFVLLQGMNSKKPVELFINSMAPYGEYILSKNEAFFKTDEIVNKAESFSGQMNLVEYWDNTPEETKAKIWEHVQGLYIMGMGALGYQEELQLVIYKTGFKA